MLPAPWLLGLALVVGLLVLIPARRLHLGGYAPRTIGLYTVALWALAMLLVVRPIGGRLLAPLVLIGYLAPFVGAPGEVRRAIDRRRPRTAGGRPPMKNVTPPGAGSTEAPAADQPASPAAGPDRPASPAAGPDQPASPAAGPDRPASPADPTDPADAADHEGPP